MTVDLCESPKLQVVLIRYAFSECDVVYCRAIDINKAANTVSIKIHTDQ